MVSLTTVAYATLAIVLAALLMPRPMLDKLGMRAVAVWLLAIPLLLFTQAALPALLLSLVILAALAPATPSLRLAFFVAIVPAFPWYIEAIVPFPGINYLITLTYYKAAVLVLFAPALFLPRLDQEPRQSWSLIDTCIVAYIAFTVIKHVLSTDIISGMRFTVDQMFFVGLPYFAITRLATRIEHVNDCLKAFMLASIVLAGIALVSTYKQWDFYQIQQYVSRGVGADFRGSYLRIEGPLTTHSLGFHLVAATVMLEYVKYKVPIGLLRLWAIRASLLAGIVFTGSRGSILALIVATIVYFILSLRSSALRWGLIASASIVGVIVGYMLAFEDVSAYSLYGGFSYRQQLLTTSLDYISENPLFGDLAFLESGRFDQLVQGLGIIDITNLYLLIGLKYGLIGLTFFFVPFILTGSRLAAQAMKYSRTRDKSTDLPVAAHSVLCGTIIGWMVLVVTTSDVGLTLHLGIFLVALGHALVQLTKGALTQPRTRDHVAEHSLASG